MDTQLADNAVRKEDLPTTLLVKVGSSRYVIVPRNAIIISNPLVQEVEESNVGDTLDNSN